MDYFEIDEFEDVVGSLRALVSVLGNEVTTPFDVKWAILSAHSALQGACVCFLTRTDGGGALTKDSEKAHLEYLDARSQEAMRNMAGGIPIKIPLPPRPKRRMANLRNLASRLPDDLRFSIADDGIWPNAVVDQHLTLLCRWRDEFTHYPPQSWSIEIAFALPMLRTTIGKIEAIATHGGYKRWNRFEETEIFPIIERLRSRLEA